MAREIGDQEMIKVENEILRVVSGSVGLGLQTGTDDLDLVGVRIESPREHFVDNFEQVVWRTADQRPKVNGNSNPSQPGDVDYVCYSLRKFISLAMGANPSILVLLYSAVSVINPVGSELRTLAPHFASKRAFNTFYGYMTQQRERLLGNRGQKRSGKIRQDLIEKYGYDTKYAYHIIRLGIQGIEYLNTGRLALPLNPGTVDMLLKIRRGEYKLSSVLELAGQLEQGLIQSRDSSPLPDEPDTTLIQNWMINKYLEAWDGIVLGETVRWLT